jgi:glycosyltransferase involved in cell wall biosynthesis
MPMKVPIVALLGRKDEPTDALEEYCRYLGEALRSHDIHLEIRRVPWELHGWREAIRDLQLEATKWREAWILLQYTALSWSLRGFPQKVLRILKILKSAGAHIAIVYHDVEPFPGSRLIDRLRRSIQLRTMRRALSLSDLAIFTVPLNKVSWLSRPLPHAHFVPVGPNLPILETSPSVRPVRALPTIGVFSITGGTAGARETQIILRAVRYAAEHLGKLRLLVFGRHAEIREGELREGLRCSSVETSVEGILQRLLECDVLLFIRGPISSRRSSALAGIACGLPTIAFEGSETAPPITDAGVVLVPQNKPDELNAALVRVLSDDLYRAELASRSQMAYQSYFSWPSIAHQIATLLDTH